MKKLNTVVFLLGLTATVVAQNLNNLVPNSSFEEVEKKIKSAGEISLAAPWRSVNMNPVDLYSESSKNADYGVPENKFGAEKARTGSNYAGVSFYGYRGRMPRTYLGTKLLKPLEEGKQYCMKFHVSLSDKSKYAANNLAMYISNDEVTEMSAKNLAFEPQIMSVTNKVFEKQFLWTAICGTYTAKGGEQYIVIGNFFADDKTKAETVRLSREFSGRQEYNAYYYIDDVSVIPTDKLGKKDCACDDIAGGSMEIEFKKFATNEESEPVGSNTTFVNSDGSKAEESIKKEAEVAKKKAEEPTFKKFSSSSTSTEEEKKVEEKPVEKKASPLDAIIYFDSKKTITKASEKSKLEALANYLKSNSKVKIVIVGHYDPSEEEIKFLGKRRGLAVEKELKLLGVSETQIEYTSSGSSELVSDSDPSKNRRVTFSIK